MQCDETIWTVCGKDFCSFKSKFNDVTLCRNVYNVTGECRRATCPLANSYYGTIIERKGVPILYLKTIERAHTPAKLWEKISLSLDTDKAFEQIELHMRNIYKDKQIERCKNRYLRIKEILARQRQLALKPEIVREVETRKIARREANREVKALKAAKIHDSVKDELLARLKQGHYGTIYNYPAREFNDLLDEEGEEEISEDEEEVATGDEEEISDIEEEEDEEEEDYEVDDIEDLDLA